MSQDDKNAIIYRKTIRRDAHGNFKSDDDEAADDVAHLQLARKHFQVMATGWRYDLCSDQRSHQLLCSRFAGPRRVAGYLAGALL